MLITSNTMAIRAKVAECIALAESKLGIKLPPVAVSYDLRGRSAGQAGHTINRLTGQKSNYRLRFNSRFVQLDTNSQTWKFMLSDTVPHEVAHIVCQAFPQYGSNHDAGWQRICRMLGGSGAATYGQEDAPEAIAINYPYTYTTSAGFKVPVSKIIHNKIQNLHMAYTYRDKGRITRESPYTLTQTA